MSADLILILICIVAAIIGAWGTTSARTKHRDRQRRRP